MDGSELDGSPPITPYPSPEPQGSNMPVVDIAAHKFFSYFQPLKTKPDFSTKKLNLKHLLVGVPLEIKEAHTLLYNFL